MPTAAAAPADDVTPPVAKRIPTPAARWNGEVVDDYAWLRNRDDPDTIAYLEAENTWCDAWFEHLAPLRDQLFEEIRSRTQETDLSVPVPRGPWQYYSRTVEGLDYHVHCRAPRGGGDEQVLLDENAQAAGQSFFSLGTLEVTPDHFLLAWSVDLDGNEHYTLRIRDLDTGVDLDDVLTEVSAGSAWSADGLHLFYLRRDEALRPYQVWRHALGTAQADDVLVFEDLDEHFYVDVDRTLSDAFIVISSGSRTTSEVHVVPAADATAPARVIAPRRVGHEYSIDHQGDRFIVLTNDDAEDFRVMTAPVDHPGFDTWVELVAHVPGRRIVQVDAFAGHLVLHEWADATPRLRVLFADGTERVLTFDTDAHDVEPGANAEYDTTVLRFGYEALGVPGQVLEEDLATGVRTLLKEQPVLGGFDRSRYVSTRLWAEAADATKVPIDVIHHVDTPLDGTAAALVYGYGSYEISIPPYFSIARLSLLDRGVVFALVHPRGGGELGRQWYEGGKLLNKPNTFSDTIACAEHLVRAGYAAPDRLALRGGSAGGLLVAACVNARPDLFAAAVAEVPFVDVVNSMSDETLPLTVGEWDEWGDPRTETYGPVMGSYSPYDNIAPVAYPPMFVTAGLNDPRVSYHEPAKYVAKMRATSTGSAPLLLRTELGAGHSGPSGRYDSWRDEARVLAFVLETLRVI